jgi:diacylglycerol kinase (ATP)
MKPNNPPLRHVLNAFFYSMQGFKAAWRYEQAFRIEVLVAPFMLVGAFFMGQNITQTTLLLFSVLLVFLAELTNSSIEAVVDLVTQEHHELAGRAKDIGSAIVFMSLLICSVVWGLIGYSKFTGAL